MAVNAASFATASTSAKSTTSTSSTSGTSNKNGSAIGAAAGMGKDDFMQLLMAQLKNQDPMKPMEDKEFITQLAQFSSLEAIEKMTAQMEELTGSQMLVQAATLIGKNVSAKLASGEVVTGPITQVKMMDGRPVAVVNGKDIDTSLITQIGN
jgi:flagellar basal-body rod modification protein FlgD